MRICNLSMAFRSTRIQKKLAAEFVRLSVPANSWLEKTLKMLLLYAKPGPVPDRFPDKDR